MLLAMSSFMNPRLYSGHCYSLASPCLPDHSCQSHSHAFPLCSDLSIGVFGTQPSVLSSQCAHVRILRACGFSYHFYTTGSNPVSPFWPLPSSLTAHCGRESYLHALLPSSGRTPAGTSILHSTNIEYSASTVMAVVWPSYLRHIQASSLFRGKCSEISMPLLTAKHVRRMQTGTGLAVLPFETMPLALLDRGTASTVHSLLPTLGVPCRPGTTCCRGWGQVIPTSAHPMCPAQLLVHINGWALCL